MRYDVAVKRILRIIRKIFLVVLTCLTLGAISMWLSLFVSASWSRHFTLGADSNFNIVRNTHSYWISWYNRKDFTEMSLTFYPHRFQWTISYRPPLFLNAREDSIELSKWRCLISGSIGKQKHIWFIGVPASVVITILAIYPSLSLAVWWYRRRKKQPDPNGCKSCGYDLTGNESGVCPECGNGIKNMQEPSR